MYLITKMYMFVICYSVGRVCQLLAAGVDVNLHDSQESQSTPLHWAASFANRDIIQCLCGKSEICEQR